MAFLTVFCSNFPLELGGEVISSMAVEDVGLYVYFSMSKRS